MKRSFHNRIRTAALHFGRAKSGNVAAIFAVAMVPIIGLVGAAVDYSRANSARTAMQAALDTVSLMISKDASGLTADQISQRAQSYFSALYVRPETKNVSITAAYTPATGGKSAKVVVSGSGAFGTDFMKVAGYPTLGFNAASTTTWGSTKMRVAMALDNTGSMSTAGKMDALKTSAKKLITTLSAGSQADGDVLISIIPFAATVNIGTSFKTQPWMDWSQWADNGSIENDWKCSTFDFSFIKQMRCGNVFNNVNNWNGCVMDRAQPYDTTADAPALLPLGTWLPADQSPWCPEQLMTLSSNWTSLKSKIDDMSPAGGTNQPIGLHWAWLSLNTGLPLNAPAKTTGVAYSDVIILMSDGLNTMDRWYGDGVNPSPEVDARQTLLCTNIKAAGVIIYTIQVNTDNDPQSTILKNCASNNQYFSATTAAGIATAFDSIGTSLTKLHLAK